MLNIDEKLKPTGEYFKNEFYDMTTELGSASQDTLYGNLKDVVEKANEQIEFMITDPYIDSGEYLAMHCRLNPWEGMIQDMSDFLDSRATDFEQVFSSYNVFNILGKSYDAVKSKVTDMYRAHYGMLAFVGYETFFVNEAISNITPFNVTVLQEDDIKQAKDILYDSVEELITRFGIKDCFDEQAKKDTRAQISIKLDERINLCKIGEMRSED